MPAVVLQIFLAAGLVLVPSVAAYDAAAEALRHAERARQLTRQRSYPEALREWESALRLAPARADFHNLHGLTLEMSGRGEAARSEYRYALRLNPGYVEARVNLAYSFLKASQDEEAGRQLDAALKLQPSDAALHLERGLIEARRGRTAAACSHFDQSRPWPQDRSTAWMIFWAYLANDRVRDAVEAAQIAAWDGPSRMQAGQMLVQSGHSAEALPFFAAARSQQITAGQAGVAMAEVYLSSCRPADALTALADTPVDAETRYRIRELRGSALLALWREGEAQAEFTKLVEQNPYVPEAYLDATQIPLQERNWHEALRILGDGLQKLPGNWLLLFRRGVVYKLSGNLEQARASLTQSLENDGEITLVAAALGEVMAALGDLRGASDLFQSTYRRTGKPAFRLAYAMALERMGNEQAAMRELEAVRNELPKSAQAPFLLGRLYEHSGRLQAAQHELEEARRRDPRLAPNLYALARLYASSGQRDKAAQAMADFQRFRRGVPQAPCTGNAPVREQTQK